MKPLKGKIVIAAGASRGAGRGIALALGEAGATVYVVARSSVETPNATNGIPGTVEQTAAEVTRRGGRGIPVRADLSDESQVAALFRRVEQEEGRLDLVANSAWYNNALETWSKRFWELNGNLWRDMSGILNLYWFTGAYAARLMVRQGYGLIVYVTDHAIPDPSAYYGQMMWDVGHHGINRMVLGMSEELKKSNVTVVGLNPGFMRTERVIMHMSKSTEEVRRQFRFDLSETPEYIGRAVAALAADSAVTKKSGQFLWAADLAKQYGFTDVDGRYVPRFSLDTPAGEIPPEWLDLPSTYQSRSST